MDTYATLKDHCDRIAAIEKRIAALEAVPTLSPEEFVGLQWKEAVAAVEGAGEEALAAYAEAERGLSKPRKSVRDAFAARGVEL